MKHGMLIALVVGLTGCAAESPIITYQATSGQTFVETPADRYTALHDALVTSASHDIPCPSDKVGVISDSRPILVGGCGYVLKYTFRYGATYALDLQSRVQVAK